MGRGSRQELSQTFTVQPGRAQRHLDDLKVSLQARRAGSRSGRKYDLLTRASQIRFGSFLILRQKPKTPKGEQNTRSLAMENNNVPSTFGHWLRDRRHRNKLVEDLAVDAREDASFPVEGQSKE